MKNQKVIYFISMLVFLVLFSTSAYAYCTTNACVGEIDRLYMTGGNLYISTVGDETSLDCNAVSDVYLTIPTSHPGFKNYYAMMLTSISMNKEIGLRIVNGSEGCTLAYVYMNN